MPLCGSANKDHLLDAEREDEKLKKKAQELVQNLAKTKKDLKSAQQNQYQGSRQYDHADKGVRDAAAAGVQYSDALEAARQEQQKLLVEIQKFESVRASHAEVSERLTERLCRLQDLQAALQLSASDTQPTLHRTSTAKGACKDVAAEANERASRAQEPLQDALTSSCSKVSVLDMEASVLRSDRRKLEKTMAKLTQECEEKRARIASTLADAAAAEAEAEGLRARASEASLRLESHRREHKTLSDWHDEASGQLETRNTELAGFGSAYYTEVEVVLPVLELTKGRKRDADVSHGQRLVEIETTHRAKEKRPSRDATLNDDTPRNDAKVCFAPYYLAKDMCPVLENRREWLKVSPSSTGVNLPHPSALESRSSDLSRAGRLVLTETG